MKLPGAECAEVPLRKVTHYLLNTAHPDGASKAKFFLSFGFTPDEPRELAEALRLHARRNEVSENRIAERRDPETGELVRFGTLYSVDGRLASLDGRNPKIRTVWMIAAGEDTPRLVTAYPL